MIPIVDLARAAEPLRPAFADATARVLASGHLLLGTETSALEAELAPALGYPASLHSVAVGSGSAAIELVLASLGIGPGDEVLVPALTAVPTASAVCAVGATPVPVDVDEATASIDPDAARAARTARTRAAIVVHLYGRPADTRALLGLGVPVVEDAAQAHGALRRLTGIAATYSFYPTKNVGGIGDGGAVITADAELASAVRRRRVHGMTEQYVHVDISQNHRMSELEAAWLRLRLPGLAAGNERRRAIDRRYRVAAPGLGWRAPHPDDVVHLSVARVDRRDAFRAELATAGVASAVHYPLAVTQQPAFARFARTPCPRAEAWAASCVSLPCFPELRDDEVERVVASLERWAG